MNDKFLQCTRVLSHSKFLFSRSLGSQYCLIYTVNPRRKHLPHLGQMSTFESNKFQTAWLGISFVSLEQWAVPEALEMSNALQSAFLGWSWLLLCRGTLTRVSASVFTLFPLWISCPPLRWEEFDTHVLNLLCGPDTEKGQISTLPKLSFIRGGRQEWSKPTSTVSFQMMMCDEKSAARLGVWFLLFSRVAKTI